jgi:hypothetical protein
MNVPRKTFLSLLAALATGIVPALAQPTELLELETITVGSTGPVTFVFSDHGTGGTGYSVQSAPSVGSPISWGPETGAVVTPLGNGLHQVTVAKASPDRFYRVISANGNPNPIQMGFATTAIQIDEGGSASATVTFSRAYHGTIRYNIGGSAAPGDYAGLTGEIAVNGTTAIIPINLTENTGIDEIKQLVLTLVSGSGAQIGAANETTITIGENDANWHGSLFDGASAIGFVVRIRQGGGGATGTLVSDGSGIIPAGEYPASLALQPGLFSFLSTLAPLDPATTLQGLPATLQLDLDAIDGQNGDVVAERELRGQGKVIIQYAGKSHLNRTNTGTFLMLPEPVRPSTAPLELVEAP